MAAKRAKRKPVRMAKAEECSCSQNDMVSSLPEWLLIFVAGFGLANAFGWVDWPIFNGTFDFIWPIVVLVVALNEVFKKGNNGCC